jgi:hypothetical protein
MKVAFKDSTLSSQVVINGTYVKVVKCGVLLYFTWQYNTTAAVTTVGTTITIVNLDGSTTALNLPMSTTQATNDYATFVLPLAYRTITLTQEPA